MWQRTQSPLALGLFSFTPQNFYPPLSGEYNDDDDDKFDDDDDDYDGGSCDGGPCFGI